MGEVQHEYPDVFITSDTVKAINTALVGFKKQMGKVAKTSNNPFFRSAYADLPTILDAVKEPMVDNGLTLNSFPVGDNHLVTRLSHVSGEFMQGLFYMKSVKDTPQDRGSVITYMMRYATGAALGLSIDKDDDGNKSSGRAATKRTATKVKTLLVDMDDPIKESMIKFVKDGKATAVEGKMANYKDSPNKKAVRAELDKLKNK